MSLNFMFEANHDICSRVSYYFNGTILLCVQNVTEYLVTFPVMQCSVKITTINDRKVLEKYQFVAGKSFKSFVFCMNPDKVFTSFDRFMFFILHLYVISNYFYIFQIWKMSEEPPPPKRVKKLLYTNPICIPDYYLTKTMSILSTTNRMLYLANLQSSSIICLRYSATLT